MTHKEGNQLDQLWTRNLRVTNAVVADLIPQVSDHCLIQVKMEATITRSTATQPGARGGRLPDPPADHRPEGDQEVPRGWHI